MSWLSALDNPEQWLALNNLGNRTEKVVLIPLQRMIRGIRAVHRNRLAGVTSHSNKFRLPVTRILVFLFPGKATPRKSDPPFFLRIKSVCLYNLANQRCGTGTGTVGTVTS
jgi:hypothetical protein